MIGSHAIFLYRIGLPEASRRPPGALREALPELPGGFPGPPQPLPKPSRAPGLFREPPEPSPGGLPGPSGGSLGHFRGSLGASPGCPPSCPGLPLWR